MTAPEDDRAQAWPPSGVDWAAPPQRTSAPAHPFATPEAGRYLVGGELGRGAMGVVHAALDARLKRTVALKRATTAAGTAHLAQEAELTAGLDHLGIIQVHDAGVDADGVPFYTMRVAAHRTLADALTETEQLPARLLLLRRVLAVCEAVAYAHDHGVVHRDLKPANILLGEFGETQVADWGLAVSVTGSGAHAPAGTPGYQAPEVASGALPATQADVHALGVLLAEVIVGQPLAVAFAHNRDALSAALAQVANVPVGLSAVVARATDALPERRYRDAKALAADLEALLNGRLVAAHRYTPWQLARRFAVAWRAPLLVAVVALVLLALAQAVAFVRTVAERDRAVAAEVTARQALQRADRNLGQALLEAARTAARADQLPEAELLAAHALRLREDPAARGVLMQARVQTARQAGPPVPVPADCLRVLPDATGDALLCLRADAAAYYQATADRSFGLRWRSPVAALDGTVTATGILVSLGPERLMALDKQDGRARAIANVQTGRGNWLPATSDHLGARIAADGVAVFDPTTGQSQQWSTCDGRGTVAVARTAQAQASPSTIAAVCDSGQVQILAEAATPTAFASGLGIGQRGASAAWWQPDQLGLVIGTHVGAVGVFDWPGRTLRYVAQTGVGQVVRIAGSDGRAVALGDRGAVAVWDLQSGAILARLPASAGRTLAVASDGELRLFGPAMTRWQVPALARALTLPGGDREHGLASAALAPDGARLAIARADGTLLVVRACDGGVLFRDQPAEHVLKFAAWSADGARLAVAAASRPGFFDYAAAGPWHRLPAPRLGGLRRVIVLQSGAQVAAPYTPGLHVISTQGEVVAYSPTAASGEA